MKALYTCMASYTLERIFGCWVCRRGLYQALVIPALLKPTQLFYSCLSCPQAKILEHDDVSYLKKILGELAMVLDQIEAELEKRKLENEGGYQSWCEWVLAPIQPTLTLPSHNLFCPQRSHRKLLSVSGPPGRSLGLWVMESEDLSLSPSLAGHLLVE